jgi:hypothetical protein
LVIFSLFPGAGIVDAEQVGAGNKITFFGVTPFFERKPNGDKGAAPNLKLSPASGRPSGCPSEREREFFSLWLHKKRKLCKKVLLFSPVCGCQSTSEGVFFDE